MVRARATRRARIWIDSRIRSTYQPRANARRLFRQYFEYGLFKPAALRRVVGSWRPRQIVPSVLLLALVLPLAVVIGFTFARAAGAAAPVWPIDAGLAASALVAASYACALLVASAVVGAMAKTYRWLSPAMPVSPIANLPVKSVCTSATPKPKGLPLACESAPVL